MPESEGSLQKSRSGGLGLFKRRRPTLRSRNMTQQNLRFSLEQDPRQQLTSGFQRPPVEQSGRWNGQGNGSQHHGGVPKGDICQLGAGKSARASQKKQKRLTLWGWLLGGRSRRRQERAQQRSGTLSHASVPHSHAHLADTASVIPLAQRRRQLEMRSRDGQLSRRSNTRLQSNQPTLVQASTSLQQSTLLQEQKTLLRDERRAPKMSQQETIPSRPQSRSLAIALYAARMVILSVGVGVLAGTVLSAWNPVETPFLGEHSNQSIKQASSFGKSSSPSGQLLLAQELAPLKTAVQGVVQQYPGFTPGVFLIDLDNNNFVDLSGSASFAAASTIKVPVLIAFFQDVDAGKIRLDEKLTMRKDLIAPESGDMQYLPPGAQFTALETATKMITISDNTATNMLIDRLGGIQAVNQRFKSWGLSATQITNLLPDLKGTNTTSPKELASLMVRVSQGELVSLRSRDRLLDIMRRTVNNSQLPQGLGEGATIAHKTGDIGTLIGDVGLVDMPSGKRYAAAVLIKRAFNDDRAYDLVQKISRTMYQHFVNAATPQKRPTVSTPVPTTPITPDLEPDATDTDAQNPPTNLPNVPEQTLERPDALQASTP
ncbi:beta-lactamase class A [Leptolyngbyaceae cyanobacterium JSC-12]|nr:beta-lactamase class A [Leptolyngbyaceae cyanobacterium JSC-12]